MELEQEQRGQALQRKREDDELQLEAERLLLRKKQQKLEEEERERKEQEKYEMELKAKIRAAQQSKKKQQSDTESDDITDSDDDNTGANGLSSERMVTQQGRTKGKGRRKESVEALAMMVAVIQKIMEVEELAKEKGAIQRNRIRKKVKMIVMTVMKIQMDGIEGGRRRKRIHWQRNIKYFSALTFG